METVIGVLAATGLAILLVLSIPVDIVLTVETSAARKSRVRLRWLFGLLNVSLRRPRSRSKGRIREERKNGGRPIAAERMWSVVRVKGLPATVARFIGRLFAAVTIRNFRFHVRFGFDDPADTGLLLAAAAPAISLLRPWSANRFSAEPDFEKEVFHIDGQMDLRVSPVRIAGASLLFLLSAPALRAARAVVWNH